MTFAFFGLGDASLVGITGAYAVSFESGDPQGENSAPVVKADMGVPYPTFPGTRLMDTAQYDAFISYSRSVDRHLATALEKSLKNFAKPTFRLRALRVFRDDASLTATPSLWGAIEDALSRSRFFILLASPESANSSWVRRELEWWLEHKSSDSLLTVVTDGVLSWNNSQTTSFPVDFFHRVATEPRWIDLRWARTSNDLSRRNPKFADNLADLAGWIHGRSKDELVGEDVTQHKRLRIYTYIVIMLLLFLTVAASISAVIALEQRSQALKATVAAKAAESQAQMEKNAAESARKEEQSARARAESAERDAIRQRNAAMAARDLEASARMRAEEERVRAETARANLLADISTRLLAEGDKPKALGYATAALNIARSLKMGESEALPRSERAMRQALFEHRTSRLRLAVTYRGHEGRVTDIAVSNDKRFLATAGDDGTVRIYFYESGELLKEVLHEGPVAQVLFVEGDRYLASASRDGVLKATSIDGTARDTTAVLGARVRGMRHVPDAGALLVWGLSGKVAVWRPPNGTLVEVALERKFSVMSAEFLPQDPDSVLLDLGNAGAVVSLQERKQVRFFPGTAVGRDIKNALGAYASNNALNVTDLRSGKVVCSVPTFSEGQALIDAASNRLIVLKLGPTLLEFWSMRECRQITTQRMDGVIKGIVAMSADQKLVAWTGNGRVSVFGMAHGEPLLQIDARFEITDLDVSQTAGRVLVWNGAGRAGVWSLTNGTPVTSFDGNAPIREARFSESGRTAWIGRESGELRVVALEDDALQDRFFHDDAVLGWRFATADVDLLTWAADGTARLWSARSSDIGYRIDSKNFRADQVAVNSGATVIFAIHQTTASAWQLDSGKPIAQTTMTTPITHLLPSIDGKSVLLSAQGGVCIWSTAGGVACRETPPSTRELAFGARSFALFNREMSTLAVATGSLATEGFVDVADDVVDVALVGPQKALAVCRRRGSIDIYVNETQRPSTVLQIGQELSACAGTEDRNRLVALAAAGSMTVIGLNETATTTLDRWSPPTTIPREQMTRFDLVRFGRGILFAGRKRLLWIDPDSRSVVRDEVTAYNLNSLAVSDDGNRLIALANSSFAMLFDRHGDGPRKLDHHSKVIGHRFLRGGKDVATWSADQTLKVWSSDEGRVKHELPHFGIVQGVAETPDAGMLVTWTDRSYISYWDLASGMKLFEMHTSDAITDVKFLANPDRMFVTFKHTGPILLPYVSRQGLGTVASGLLSALRPFGPTESCILKPASTRCRIGGTPRSRIGSSSLSGEGFLTGWDGAAELGILKDGGIVLVSDRPLPDIIQLVEYNDFDQLLTLFTFDGAASTLALPMTAAIKDSLRRQKMMIIFSLFPDHEPIGYQVPLAHQ